MPMLTIYTQIGHNGQEVTSFTIPLDECPEPDDVRLENNFTDSSIECFLQTKTNQKSNGVREILYKDGLLRIDAEPFAFRAPFRLVIQQQTFTAENAEKVYTMTADDFTYEKEGDLLYRLYHPQAMGPRPLILFLHGGGESGRDNQKQLTSCFGPTKLAESYPDCFVMAPQAFGKDITPEDIEKFSKMTFATSDQPTDVGWNREYLSLVCDKIREMVHQKLVNPERIYVTGLSMGGGGTLRALSVGSDLFAAALPICPSMTPETFAILKGLTKAKLWIMASYIDHTLYRHKYLVDGILHLRDAGNAYAKLSLFSPEELAEFGIGVIDDMPLKARFGWNHTCWILAYENVHGALAWMMEQIKS